MAGTVLSILRNVGLLDVLESLDDVACWLDGLDLSEDGRRLAEFLHGRIPVIYTTSEYEAGVARTWRIKFNENAKIPALYGCLPEANHNEIMGFPAGSGHPISFVFLTDENADPRIQKRFPLTAELLTRNGYPVQTHPMVGDTPLRKALHSLMLADWTSYHLARLRGVDPITIPDIQQFKERLNQ
jgi:glucose/mannose-6-phosphate isomerase